uniref:foldase protein PrsA n=1 Tax=Acetatifactor sp. TaxID=1872090 RepID=UPI004056E4D5
MSIWKKIDKKLWTVGLAAAFTIVSLAACGTENGDTKVVFTTGFGKDDVFRVDNEICTRAEVMVYLTTIQNQYESVYGAEIWSTDLNGVTLEENVKETVLAKIAQIKTMYLLAQEKGVVLDESEEEKITQIAQEYFDSLNETEVEQMGVSYEVIERLYREYALADKVYHQIIQDINPEISDDEARTITVQHILVRTMMSDGNGNSIPYSAEDKQAAYDEICAIRELAVSGEHDFEELASQYSDDSVLTYSFGKGEMDAAFEEASFLLGTEEISDVVESEVGYHIIKCLNTFNREETDANKLKIVEERREEAFGKEYDAFVDTLARKLNQKVWDEISFLHDSNVVTSDFFDLYDKYFVVE